MRNKIFTEFIGPRVFRIFVPIHICYLFISQFTKFEDLKRARGTGGKYGRWWKRERGRKRVRKGRVPYSGSYEREKRNKGERNSSVNSSSCCLTLPVFFFRICLHFPLCVSRNHRKSMQTRKEKKIKPFSHLETFQGYLDVKKIKKKEKKKIE